MIRWGVLGFVLVLAVPLAAFAALNTFRDLADYGVKIMNSVIGTLVITGLVIYFFGLIEHLFKREQTEGSQLRKFLLMGIVALFVMVSIWGILEILGNTLKGQSFTGSGTDPAGYISPDAFK